MLLREKWGEPSSCWTLRWHWVRQKPYLREPLFIVLATVVWRQAVGWLMTCDRTWAPRGNPWRTRKSKWNTQVKITLRKTIFYRFLLISGFQMIITPKYNWVIAKCFAVTQKMCVANYCSVTESKLIHFKDHFLVKNKIFFMYFAKAHSDPLLLPYSYQLKQSYKCPFEGTISIWLADWTWFCNH